MVAGFPMKKLNVGFLLLLVNSVYLVARPEASLFYFANVGLHLLLGALLAGAALRELGGAWRRLPVLLRIAVPGLLVAAVTGLALAFTGADRQHYALLRAHVVASIVGALPALAWMATAAFRVGGGDARAKWGVVAACTALVATAGIGVRDRSENARVYRIANPAVTPARMEDEGSGPTSPFFPSSARTNVGGIIPANFFLTSESCGRCHKEIFAQWRSSAHHFSSFNNQWYRRSIEYMQDVVGTKPSKWCAGCHDHAVFFNGRFDRPIKEQIDTPEAQAGLACTSCHSIVHVGSTMGQGDFTVEYPPLHDLAVSTNPFLAWAHDAAIRIAPEPHRRTFIKSFHREQTAEFCSSCHKVHLDVPVNQYRWFRGFNDYDNWQASGISGQGARSFYYPPKPQRCADCHMPLVDAQDPAAKDGKVRSHRFPAANTALPFVNHDHEQLRITQEFLQNGAISVDVFGIVREPAEAGSAAVARPAAGSEPRLASTFAQGEESASFGAAETVVTPALEVLGPLDKIDAVVRRGESVRVEVVVRTRKVGHFFPGGTVDAFDVWVELEAVDDSGRTIFHSGAVTDGGKGPVEVGAHFYRSLQLDDHGNPINRRNAWMSRSVAYVRLIPPGAADTIHYRLNVPKDCVGNIHLKTKVNYRKFAWWNTQWAFAGVRDPNQGPYEVTPSHDDGKWVFTGDTSKVSGQIKAIPDIPITVMAQAAASLRVIEAKDPLPPQGPLLDASVRERWNDYGIGLLLQGDLKSSEAAFLKVTQMEPGYADGWVNVARARIQEGNLAGAEEMLQKALAIDARLAKSHFFLGTLLKARGAYDDAQQHFEIAAAQYPRDRVVLGQLGRVLFLKRQYREAIAVLGRVLAVDPEDLQAHYNLMLAWQGLGDADHARAEQVLYERFKADESAQFITGPYRQLHPEDNNERQSIHEHVTIALAQTKNPTYAGSHAR